MMRLLTTRDAPLAFSIKESLRCPLHLPGLWGAACAPIPIELRGMS
jgi:hypothetical protein